MVLVNVLRTIGLLLSVVASAVVLADTVWAGELRPPEGVEIVTRGADVELRWKPVPGASGYFVYASEAGKAATRLNAEKIPTTFRDLRTLEGDVVYSIHVTAVADDGTESGPSEAVTMRGPHRRGRLERSLSAETPVASPTPGAGGLAGLVGAATPALRAPGGEDAAGASGAGAALGGYVGRTPSLEAVLDYEIRGASRSAAAMFGVVGAGIHAGRAALVVGGGLRATYGGRRRVFVSVFTRDVDPYARDSPPISLAAHLGFESLSATGWFLRAGAGATREGLAGGGRISASGELAIGRRWASAFTDLDTRPDHLPRR